MNTCDIVLVGVGGQGVVTLGDLIGHAALSADAPISYVPTKGMAQRGGFVKVEIRLGHEQAGPRVPEAGADVVVAMERSEALKGVRFVRPTGRFILYDHVWEPTGVMLGQDDYPSLEAATERIKSCGGNLLVLDPAVRPSFDTQPVAANIYVLGALFGQPAVCALVSAPIMEQVLIERWPRASESNVRAFQAGLEGKGR
ncbi:2-oxoacid:acceptor oxidoreductase family protein [Candidatus Bipolaricaulota bacterium]